ncbi:MAG: hypothetical protein AAB837_01405 [Patescibacteria group bacterium]
MHKNSFYISFSIWLIIIPFLGVPIVWRDALVFISGLFLILVSLGPTILKKLQTKSKPKRKQINELRFSEDSPNITHSPTPSLKLREGESETSSNSPLN